MRIQKINQLLLVTFFIALNINIIYSQHDLFTLNKKGKYIPILNERHGITQRYEGGIWIARHNGRVLNIHRPVAKGYFNNGVNQNLNPPPPVPKQKGLFILFYFVS
jgi:hypothetical protein